MISEYNLTTHIKRGWNTLKCLLLIRWKYWNDFTLLKKSIRLGEKMILSQKIVWDDGDDFSKVTIAFIAKGLQTTRAVLLLCKSGLGQDALPLLRVLFENLIDFRYMHVDKNRVRNYLLFDFNYKLKLGRIIERRTHLPVDTGRLKQKQDELQAEWDKVKHLFIRKNDSGKNVPCSRWSCKDLRTMAVEVGWEDAYDYFYPYASGFTHSVAGIANDYVLGREGDSVVVEVGASETLVKEALSTARTAFLGILDIVNDEYKLGFDKEISELAPKPNNKNGQSQK